MTPFLRSGLSWAAITLASVLAGLAVVEATRISLEASSLANLALEVDRRAIEVSAQTLNGNVMGAVSTLGLVNSSVKATVRDQTAPNTGAIPGILQAIGASYQASGVFLVGGDGVIRASWDSGGKSAVGLDVKFRPYFLSAMKGDKNVYAAIGLNLGERVLYFAAPIRDAVSPDAPIIGAVVARLDIGRVESVLNARSGPALLLSPQKVTFASNRGDWITYLAGTPTGEQLEEIKALKQFGTAFENGSPKILPFDIAANEVLLEHRRYAVARSPIHWNDPHGDWSLVILGDMDAAMPLRKKIALGGAATVITFGLGVTLLGWRRRLRRAVLARLHAESEMRDYAGKLEAESILKSRLAELSADLHKAPTLDRFARTFMLHAVPQIGADYGVFYAHDERSQLLIPVGGHGVQAAELTPVAPGQGLVGQCAKDRLCIDLPDRPDSSMRIAWGFGAAAPNFVLFLPIALTDRLLGVIVLASLQPWQPGHRALLDSMLPIVATNLEILDRNLGTERQAEILRSQQTRLRDTESWYRGIIEAAPDGMLVMDEQGSIILANPQLEAMFGYERGTLSGRKIENLVPASIRDRHVGLRNSYLETGGIRPMGRDIELLGVRSDGSEFRVEVGLSRLPALGGRGYCVCASVRDTTERIRAEEALRCERAETERTLVDAREQLQRILDTSPASIGFSSDGVIHFTNPRFTRTFGVKAGDPAPQLYVDPAEREDMLACLERDGIVDSRHVKVFDARREPRDMLATYLSITYDSRKGILGWLVDITEHRGPEKATAAPDIDPDIFDFERLGPVYHWDQGKLVAVLTRMLDDAAAKVADMENAPPQRIRDLAHGLKGLANSAGANRLGSLSGNIEILALDGNLEGLGMMIPLLAPTLVELREALSSFLAAKP